MLSNPEKIVFILAALTTIVISIKMFRNIFKVINRGHGTPDWKLAGKRLVDTLVKTVALTPAWRSRFWASLFHALVVWGFMFYLVVNIGDVVEGLVTDFTFLGTGNLGNIYRLMADILSVGALVGMTMLLIRRCFTKSRGLWLIPTFRLPI